MVDADNKVVMKTIHIGTDYGTTVEVDAGLLPGDKIIDNPSDSLQAGDTVHVSAKVEG